MELALRQKLDPNTLLAKDNISFKNSSVAHESDIGIDDLDKTDD